MEPDGEDPAPAPRRRDFGLEEGELGASESSRTQRTLRQREFGSLELGRPPITTSICLLLWRVTYLGFGVPGVEWIQSPPHSKLSPFLMLIMGCAWHRVGPLARSSSRRCWSSCSVPGGVWSQSRADEVLALLRPRGGRAWIRK